MHREGFALVEWDPGEPLEDLAKGLGLMLREHRLLAPRRLAGGLRFLPGTAWERFPGTLMEPKVSERLTGF